MERSVEGDWHNSSDSKSSGSELKGIGYYQYVAETVKNDMKICPRFGSSSNLSKQLPSLDISEHKRWCCANYTHKIGDGESAEDKINDAFVNAGSTNFVSKNGDRVDETNNITTEMMLSKKCLNREIETNIQVQDKNLQRGNFSIGEDVLQKSIGTGMMTSQLESELYLKEKLFQTLNNFKNAQKNTENDTIQKKNIPYYPLTILKGNESCYPLKANRVESNQSSEKRVIPIERQPIMVQSDQSSRNGFTNLHHSIDLTNKQEIYISSNPLQQNQTLMEMSDPANKINIYGIQDHLCVTIPKRNQQITRVTERGSSIYIPSIDNMEMFRNRHEQSNPLIQNGILPYINPLSTNFHPLYANAGFLKGSTSMTQFKDQPIKLSNSMQVSSISTRWGLQNVERSNPINLSIAQGTTFQSYNLQNNQNHKCGQVSLGSLEKGKTISDLRSVQSIRGEDMRTKGQGVSLRSQEKKRKAHSLEQFDGTKLQQSRLSSGLLHTIRDSGLKADLMQNDNISTTLDLGDYSTSATILPVSSIPKKDPLCFLNQNPTDIVDVDYERYFRTAEDQSIRDSSSLQRKFAVNIKLDERQRQMRKERPGRMLVVGFKS